LNILIPLLFVDRGLGEWEWLGPGSTHGGRLTGPALFGAWGILGYGFQDMVFRTWDLNFRAWEILGYGFQDMVSGLRISTLGLGKF
jgi:hypothetical protein